MLSKIFRRQPAPQPETLHMRAHMTASDVREASEAVHMLADAAWQMPQAEAARRVANLLSLMEASRPTGADRLVFSWEPPAMPADVSRDTRGR